MHAKGWCSSWNALTTGCASHHTAMMLPCGHTFLPERQMLPPLRLAMD